MKSSREDPRFVRFNKPRKSGRSMHYHKMRFLAGVSVYPGRLIGDNLFLIDTSEINGLPDLAAFAAGDYPAFFCSGVVVGTGASGEPLLDVKDVWRVPCTTDLTCTDVTVQPGLRFWSEGPRDGKAGKSRRLILERLEQGAYTPGLDMERALEQLRAPGEDQLWRSKAPKDKKRDKKRERQARKKNRKKKR